MRVHRNVRPRRLPRARACGFLATEGDGLCRPVSRQENERYERLVVRTQIPGHLSRQFRSTLIWRTALVRTCAEVAGIRSNGFSWLEFVCYAYGAARPSPTLHTRHVVSTPTWYTNRNLLRNKRYFKYMYVLVLVPVVHVPRRLHFIAYSYGVPDTYYMYMYMLRLYMYCSTCSTSLV